MRARLVIGAALIASAIFGSAAPAAAQDYRFPIELPASGTAPYITAYRDLDGGAGRQDWNCGTITYNGHRGTDIGIGGFPVMDAGSRWVVAAADGRVTGAADGCFDRCTTGTCACAGGSGNYVTLTHDDGKTTIYGHLQNGTVQVQMGQRVSCGARLGKVGSSGFSTGPHLHFEPKYASGVSDDPFAGPCGGPTSFWVAQGGYNGLPGTTCAGGAPPPPPPPPANGTIKGVLWDLSATAGAGDPGNIRIAGGTVTIANGPSVTARAGDAFWSFSVAAGTYQLTASAPGFVSEDRTVTVTSGQDSWASIGLRREATKEPPPPPPPPPVETDAAELVEESVLNPMEIGAGERFIKSWTVRNSGTSTWRASSGYRLTFVSSERFDGPIELFLEDEEAIAPDQSKTWVLDLVAPGEPGMHAGIWTMAHEATPFGPMLGVQAIVVVPTEPVPEGERPPGDPGVPADPVSPPQEEPMFELTHEPTTLQDSGCGCRATARRSDSPWAIALIAAMALAARPRRRRQGV